MYSFVESDIDLEGVFSTIGYENDIKSFTFVTYFLQEYERDALEFMTKGKARKFLEESISERIKVPKNYFDNHNLTDVSDQSDIKYFERLGVCSRVKISGNRRNFHMKHIDFDCDPNEENLERVRKELYELKTGSGWIVFSGNSYHFHGMNVLNVSGWNEFINNLNAKAKGNSTVDRNFIFISKLKKYSVLRVLESFDKGRPKVILEVK